MRRTSQICTVFGRLLDDRQGLTNLEYGVILSLLAVTSVGALNALGVSVKDGFTGAGDAVAANREAFYGSGSSTNRGTTSGGSNSGNLDTNGSSGGAGDTNGTTPDEPPVAAADMPVEAPTELPLDPITPDEPPMAAMKAGSGS